MKKIIYIFSVITCFSFTSCSDLLDTEPNDLLTNEVVLQDVEGVQGVLNNAYNQLRSVDYLQRNFIVQAGALADNIKQTINNTSRLNGISNNQPFAHFTFWESAYKVITSANFVISGVNNFDASVAQEDSDQLLAEAHFLRAIAHFDLVRVYARNPNFSNGENLGIPIVTEPVADPSQSFPSRNTSVEVYSQIINDLNTSAGLITRNQTASTVSESAIHALLSRVYLYQGDWASAASAASTAIDLVGFDIENNNYTNIFSQASETIFGLNFLPNENPGLNGSLQGLFFVNPSNGIGYGDFVVREDLLKLYGENDVRKNDFIATVKSGENVHFIGKYLGYGGEFGLDQIPLIRLSEVYLNRAEALAENDDLSGALSDLNKIRNRAGLSNFTSSIKQEVIDAILLERRLELAFEGHRWFDLKRRGLDIPKGIQNIDCQTECTIPNNNYRILANIPTS